MTTALLGLDPVFGVPGMVWYPLLVILLIVDLVLYVKYRKQMS
jgi:hypothetical protein